MNTRRNAWKTWKILGLDSGFLHFPTLLVLSVRLDIKQIIWIII